MKLLKLSATGLPLFPESLTMSFFAQQRVDEQAKKLLRPFHQDSRFYLNCVNAIIGINASGKTSVLKVILLALDILNNAPVNHSETRDILGNAKDAVLEIIFLAGKGDVCRLETHIGASRKGNDAFYRITAETLWVKPLSSVTTKKKLTDFAGVAPFAVRSDKEEFLPDDTSIMIAYNKKKGSYIPVESLLSLTNRNVLMPVSENISADVIRFLDPTIAKLSYEHHDQKTTIQLQFKGESEIVISDPAELNRYLSSGTIKGIVTFTMAIRTLQSGGYLVIDELENHFNKEIAATLIRLFMNASVNCNGGILFFTTHYPELLDEFERNDSIFITRNRNGISVSNLLSILKRNDIKKSDAYQSDMLDGTVPSYEAYLKLKKSIQSALLKGEG